MPKLRIALRPCESSYLLCYTLLMISELARPAVTDGHCYSFIRRQLSRILRGLSCKLTARKTRFRRYSQYRAQRGGPQPKTRRSHGLLLAFRTSQELTPTILRLIVTMLPHVCLHLREHPDRRLPQAHTHLSALYYEQHRSQYPHGLLHSG